MYMDFLRVPLLDHISVQYTMQIQCNFHKIIKAEHK